MALSRPETASSSTVDLVIAGTSAPQQYASPVPNASIAPRVTETPKSANTTTTPPSTSSSSDDLLHRIQVLEEQVQVASTKKTKRTHKPINVTLVYFLRF